MKAGPRAPTPEFGMITRHAGGKVLEVADGIPDEESLRAVDEIPDEGLIRSGLIWNHRGFI